MRYATRDDDQYFYPEKTIFIHRDAKQHEVRREELTWPEGVRRYTYRRWPAYPSGRNVDNVQIGFNAIPAEKKGWYLYPPGTMPRFMCTKTTDYEFALNPVAPRYGGGTEIWRLMAPGIPRKHFFPRQPKADVDGGPVTSGKLQMKRQGNTRIVEAAIPWSEIPEVKRRIDDGARRHVHLPRQRQCRRQLRVGRRAERFEDRHLHATAQLGRALVQRNRVRLREIGLGYLPRL